MVALPNIQTPPYKPAKPSSADQLWKTYPTAWTSSCHFGIPTFLHVLKDLTLHPERNSSLILRADPLPLDPQSQIPSASSSSTSTSTSNGNSGRLAQEDRENDDDRDELERWLDLHRLEKVEEIRVRLMPKQPQRDPKLDQRVLFYRTPEKVEHDHQPKIVGGEGGSDQTPEIHREKAVVVMIPLVKGVEDMPFYHPPVRKVVFLYEAIEDIDSEDVVEQMENLTVKAEKSEEGGTAGDGNPVRGRISISYLPFETTFRPGDNINTNVDTNTNIDSSLTTSEIPTSSPLAGLRRTSLPRKRSPLAGPSTDPTPAPTTKAKEDPKAVEVRLQRTCLALLERVYRHGFGTMIGYKKRVNHDTVVKREPFQDLYLVLKERHRHLDSRAAKPGSHKVEDVKRHVFKGVDSSLPNPLSFCHSDLSEWGSQDVAIAAFLMLLWKDMYPARPPADKGEEGAEEWDTWGRPPNGFIDLGCGNGLLVHILISEGYNGKGYELRSRRTWPLYPTRTQQALVESPLDPPSFFPDTIEEWSSGSWSSKASCVIEENTFLIGNHSDELTPWLPLLSLIPSTPVPHLSLPCCLHTLDGPFTLSNYTAPPHPHSPDGNFEHDLEAGQSRYKSFLMWLGWVGLQCGWVWETEPLRIPSTRGWGIVARRRWSGTEDDLESCRAWALEEVMKVRGRGAFKVRVKEGKEH